MMSCFFCNMKGMAAVDEMSQGKWKDAGTMTLLRSGAGESKIHIELDASAMVTVSTGSVCSTKTVEHVEIPTHIAGYARGVKYCPFCGEEL